MNKPIIIFYEPFEIIVEENSKMISYLDELLEKYVLIIKVFSQKIFVINMENLKSFNQTMISIFD